MPTISSLPSLSTTTNLNNVVFPVVETVGNVLVTKNATLGQVISAAVSSSPVKSVAGQTGNVTLSYHNITGTPPVATKSAVGAVSVGSGIGVSAAGVISLAAATTTASGGVVIGSGLKVDSSGTVSLSTATTSTIGGIIVGSGLSVTPAGVLSVNSVTSVPGYIGSRGYTGSTGAAGPAGPAGSVGPAGPAGPAGANGIISILSYAVAIIPGSGLTAVSSVTNGVTTSITLSVPVATTTTVGSVKIGSGLSVTSGTISVPVATTTTFGSIKVGSGLSVTSGTISVTGGAGGVGYTGSAGTGGTVSGYTGSQGVAGTTGYVGSAGTGSTFTGGTVANPTTFSTTASFNSNVNFNGAVSAVGIIGSTVNNFAILGGLTVANSFSPTQGASTNSTTGALVVIGGVGISGNVNIGGNLTVNGQSLSSNGSNSANAVFTGTVTAASFVSTSPGTPTLYGASNLNLTAVGRVQVSQSPFRLWSISSATRATLAPGNGDLIYNSDVNKFQGYANSAWVDITGASGSGNGYTGSASTVAGYNGSLGYTGSAGAGYTGSASTIIGYTGSSSGNYTQGSTGTVTRTITAKLQESVSVADYGAVGNGTTDDTAAIQAALNAVSAAGGGRVIIPNNFRCLIDSATLIIPNRVNLAGPHVKPGGNLPHTDATLTATTGAIILNPLYTINLAPGTAGSSGISGLYIFAKGLTMPTSDADAIAKVAAWTGTAITLGNFNPVIFNDNTAHDSYVGHCHILGFNQAIWGDWCARYEIEYVTGDCQNGIYTTNIYDLSRIYGCHFWDFFTYGRPLASWRSGIGYNFDYGNDWTQVENCFTFGHQIGFRVNANEVRLIGCGSDGYNPNTPAGTKAFYITSASMNTHLIGCQAASHETGYYIDSTDFTTLLSCAGWAPARTNHVFMDNGYVKILGSHFYDPQSNASVATGSALKWAHIAENSFNNVGTVYSLNTVTRYNVEILQSNNYFNSSGIDASTAKIVTGAGCGESKYSIGGANGYQLRFYHSTGTTTSPQVVNNGEQLGTLWFYGHNGTSFSSDTQLLPHLTVRAHVDGPVSGVYVPTAWIVSTAPNNGFVVDRNVTDSVGDFRPLANNTYNLGRAGDSTWKNIYSTNSPTVTSDERTKTEITTATLGLDFINALHPVSYKFKEGSTVVTGQRYRDADGNECSADATGARPAELISHTVPGARTHWGLIAQEVKQAVDAAGVDFGGWILTDINDPNSQQALRYEQFISPLIKAVQELTAQVKDLQSKIK